MHFLQKGIIVLYYVYYCLLFTQTSELSDESFASLKEDFLCADEGESDRHLDVEVETTDGMLTLKQP